MPVTSSPRLAVLLAVVDEEVLDRDRRAPACPCAARSSRRGRSAPAACRRSASRWRRCRRGCRLARTCFEPSRRSSSPRSGSIAPKIGLDLGIGRACADQQLVAGIVDVVEAAGPADQDDLRQVAHLLGDPQPDIGRPGDDRGVGMALVEGGEAVERTPGAAKKRSSSPTKTSSLSARKESSPAVSPELTAKRSRRGFAQASIAASTIGR